MNQQTLRISENLFNRLNAEAQFQQMNIEQLLEDWEQRYSKLRKRQEAVQQIDAIRERITAKYGVMPDSTELIREDRDSR